jgi:hypothetical protein
MYVYLQGPKRGRLPALLLMSQGVLQGNAGLQQQAHAWSEMKWEV